MDLRVIPFAILLLTGVLIGCDAKADEPEQKPLPPVHIEYKSSDDWILFKLTPTGDVYFPRGVPFGFPLPKNEVCGSSI